MCSVDIAVPANSLLYMRRTYLGASDQVLARGPVEVIAVP
jgi:hypothetical protein